MAQAGVQIDAEISTRVPEKLSVDMLQDVRIHSDNTRCFKECAVIVICVPKHKLRNVLNDIREEYSAHLATSVAQYLNYSGSSSFQQLVTYHTRR